MAFLTEQELNKLGFEMIGRNVKISEKASVYDLPNITIGDYSKIDDFCILSAGTKGIFVGRNVHIACYTSLLV